MESQYFFKALQRVSANLPTNYIKPHYGQSEHGTGITVVVQLPSSQVNLHQ